MNPIDEIPTNMSYFIVACSMVMYIQQSSPVPEHYLPRSRKCTGPTHSKIFISIFIQLYYQIIRTAISSKSMSDLGPYCGMNKPSTADGTSNTYVNTSHSADGNG